MATNNAINAPIPFAISQGGSGVTSVTVVATTSSWAGWDVNKNMSANSFLAGYATTATAAGTTTLVVGSAYQQFFTGSTTQTVLLPVTSTLVLGQSFFIVNNSSGVVTVQSSGGNTIKAMSANTTLLATVISTSGTTAASWSITSTDLGSGTVTSGTANQLSYYQATGNTVVGLASANNGVLITSSGGVPSISSVLPAGITGSQFVTDLIRNLNNSGTIISFGAISTPVNFFTFFNSATGTGPSIQAVGTDSNIDLVLLGTGTGGVAVHGTGTNNNAAAGYVGEEAESIRTGGSPLTVTTVTPTTLVSLSLTAGDWDVWGNVGSSATTTVVLAGGLSLVNNTLPALELYNQVNPTGATQCGINVPARRFSFAATTTVYLIIYVSGTGTISGFGGIYARRRR